jgi:hypothetical protein
MNANCSNKSCGEAIQFDVSPHDDSVVVKCPHCGLEAEYFNSVKLLTLFNNMERTLAPLESDARETFNQWRQDKQSQFWARAAIRCLCAVVEAKLFNVRRLAEKIAAATRVQFNQEEIDVLTEQKANVDSNGNQTLKPYWLPFRDSVKESIRLYVKASGLIIKIDYGVVGYDALCETFKRRDRLMHPKNPDDVQVSEKDMDTAYKGFKWLNTTVTSIADQVDANQRMK